MSNELRVEARDATAIDNASLWEIFKKVIERGDSFVWEPSTRREEFTKYWFAPEMKTIVFESENEIIGSYWIKSNQLGLGSHIANGAYMVHPDYQGQGIGKILCDHSIKTEKQMGYLGLQFNIVVSTNEAAVRLWKAFGFDIVGTIPGGFNHKKLGFVDSYIMFRKL
ncbi:MAG: GNAT family N-acetyltransferase [Candidatus Kapaibacterium sp.]